MSYDRAGMINKSHNMKRTQQVVEDAKASYHGAKPGHHLFSVILARCKTENGCSGLSCFTTC